MKYSVTLETAKLIHHLSYVCADDDRPNLSKIRVEKADAEKGHPFDSVKLTATNGSILTQIIIDDVGLNQMLTAYDKTAGYISRLEAQILSIRAHRSESAKYGYVNTNSILSDCLGQFVNIDSKDVAETTSTAEDDEILHLDLALLKKVIPVVRCVSHGEKSGVTIRIPKDKSKAISVEPYNGISVEDSRIHVMPLRSPVGSK